MMLAVYSDRVAASITDNVSLATALIYVATNLFSRGFVIFFVMMVLREEEEGLSRVQNERV